ncbi:MAG TPA: VanZ family protein [Kofleriaceae bacterium]|nr:VanZ family protein [Kofleriaceae bacterium]
MWIRVALPVYWLALFAATHYPRVRVPGEIPQSDKAVHFAAFGLLAWLFWRLLAARARPLTAASVWIAAAVLAAYATLDEYTQQFVGRHTDLADWIANLAGILGVLAVLELRRRGRAARGAAGRG